MSVLWTIGGVSLENLGLEFVGGTFRTGAASEMRLRRVCDFDAVPLFSYADPVTLVRNGTKYFQGKVASRPSYGSGSNEGQEIVIRDAWQDLEDTVYLEPWSVGAGTFDFPVAVLGVNKLGESISTGTQVIDALAMAIDAGADLQAGSIPAGIPLWPTEVRNVSVAEVIRISTRLHPDWVPWIDHSTTPPTINFTPRATLAAVALDVSGAGDVESFSVTPRDDLKPDAVRITYTNATIIDGVTYRDGILDKWPEAGPDKGPRVLSSVIELAGGQMQFQKSRIQTRNLPTDQATAKAWLKLKFPHLRDVPDGEFNVTEFEKTLVEEIEDHPDPINPRAVRLDVDNVDDLPRELVRGSIEDWMRKKVGQVRVKVALAVAGGASAATKEAIAKGMPPFTVTGTDAVTKIYKGVTQWVAPEAAPTGIAQAVYESLETYQYEGSVTLVLEDVTAARYHGTALNLLGGMAAWATMKAGVNQVDFDIDSGSVTLRFGPAAYLQADDFLELQRLLRGRAPTWMSSAERTSNELGAENDPGSKGDTVGGYDIPQTVLDPAIGGEAGTTPYRVSVRYDSEAEMWMASVEPGFVVCRDPSSSAADPLKYWMPVDGEDVALNAETPPEFEVTDGQVIYCRVKTNNKGVIEEAPVITVDAADKESTHFQRDPDSVDGDYYYQLCSFKELELPEGADPSDVPELVVDEVFHEGGAIEFVPNLIRIKSIGGKRELVAPYDTTVPEHQIRSLEQLDGGQAVIVKPLEEGESEGGTIKFKGLQVYPEAEFPVRFSDGSDVAKLLFDGVDSNGSKNGIAWAFKKGICTQFQSTGDDGGANFNLALKSFQMELQQNGEAYEITLADGSPLLTLYVREGRIYSTLESIPDEAPAASKTYNLYIRPQTGGASLPPFEVTLS
ncbi:hypothetical protein [Luteolibacter marinus]|uniref:hypothetical protein n=1 Tax=Luteolibacter marinus TaxID=2776705 RepID=UPI00186848ED|nr:hypothetical protein [Luteolibacter marinus]